MKVLKYENSNKNDWNNFVLEAKNRHFFFYRDYMDYHADRFQDYSLLVYDEKDKLIALLPANLKDSTLYSHQGLTFGGVLVDTKIKAEKMLEIFDLFKEFLLKENIRKIVYKCIPYIYHLQPSEEDKYALFRNEAKLIRRDISSTIYLDSKGKYSKGRKWSVNVAKKAKISVTLSLEYENYWNLLTKTLASQHDTKPVHSLEEITKLANLFPENIKLYIAKKEEKVLGGTVIFENDKVAHTQYLVNGQEGREVGALDLVIDYLINEVYEDKKYFDFGMSNENNGLYLNTGLIAQKEGFGASAIAHDTYELNI